jgi:hypothetical protein
MTEAEFLGPRYYRLEVIRAASSAASSTSIASRIRFGLSNISTPKVFWTYSGL